MTHAELMQRRKEIEDGITVAVHSIPVVFETTPGIPENPDEPKASEGMEAFRSKVYDAINAHGWNVYMNAMAEHDFIIMELYDSSAICQDTLNGKYYKLPITVDADGGVVLGDPEEYDITYTPAESAPTEMIDEPPASLNAGGSRMRSSRIPLQCEAMDGRPGVYRILICSSGFAKKWVKHNGERVQMYLPIETLVDGVKEGRFDGGRSFLNHPNGNREETGKPKREKVASGYVIPGTVEVVKNLAGGVDVFGQLKVLATSDGSDVKVVLDEQHELRKIGLNVTLIENSIFSENVDWELGEVEGRRVLELAKLNERVDVDFVDNPAIPRASVKGRLAASASPDQTKGSLSMDEKQELAQLRKDVAELKPLVTTLAASADENKKKADRLELEKTVDAELSASGMTVDDQKIVRPILLAISDSDLRKAQLEMSKRAFLSTAKAGASGGNGGADNGDGKKTTPKPLNAEVQTAIERAAKTVGLSADQIANAQLKVMGAAE
jgi:hypothetical protein